MKPFVWLLAILLVVAAQARDVRDNNGGNCVGVKSCRPRCVTFRVDRNVQECASSKGIFRVESKLNPWDIKRFQSLNCEPSNTCINGLCGQDLSGDLTVRIGEEGHTGSMYFTTVFLSEDDDRFTYCSVYPCPKDECAVPEQMGSSLHFDFLRGSAGLDEAVDPILRMEMYLKAAFVGPPIQSKTQNSFGPLHVEWMDDPTGCRDGDFSPYAPVAPLSDRTILTNTTTLPQSLYCTGKDYDHSPLPQTRPPTPPTMAPSASPTSSPMPTSESTLSSIQLNQLDNLEIFYSATAMSSSSSQSRHNWFVDLDYCSYTGVTCDARGYVRSIDLTALRLEGSLPTEIGNLHRLQQLQLVNNNIGGTLPTEMAQLTELTHIELGSNSFVGPIPSELATLEHLRRFMLQNNKLHGTIPEDLCQLNGMTAFDISGNVDMHGEIPPCFGNLSLEVLRVDDVGLVGEVPKGLCGTRPFNGLFPNVYGCRAIACPQGEFEPTRGREDGNQTECQPCAVPSNVIGSTTCMVVDGNTLVTPVPTASAMPTTAPSVSPTSQPSPSPSASMPVETGPPQEPSSAPSSSPTTKPDTEPPSPAPTEAVTPEPTILPTKAAQTVHLTVLFQNVSTAMTEVEDVKTFERITEEFVAESVPSVQGVEILSQSLRPPTKDDAILTVHYTRLLESGESLFVQMQIEGDGSNENFEDSVVGALQDIDAYQTALSRELEMFKPAADEPPVVEPEPQDNERRINWKLLGSALGLSVLAIVTVFLVRHYRKRQHLDEPQFIPEPKDPAPTPERRGLTPYDVSLSEESSGGWASEDSEEDFTNQDKSIAAWSQSNELCLMSTGPETLV